MLRPRPSFSLTISMVVSSPVFTWHVLKSHSLELDCVLSGLVCEFADERRIALALALNL